MHDFRVRTTLVSMPGPGIWFAVATLHAKFGVCQLYFIFERFFVCLSFFMLIDVSYRRKNRPLASPGIIFPWHDEHCVPIAMLCCNFARRLATQTPTASRFLRLQDSRPDFVAAATHDLRRTHVFILCVLCVIVPRVWAPGGAQSRDRIAYLPVAYVVCALCSKMKLHI